MSSRPSERPQVLTLNVRDGGRLCVPENLGQITPYILLEQEDWFEDEIRFVRRWLRPGMRVVDVGANYGVYTLAAARAVGAEGRIWAYEPTPASAEYLQRSLQLNAAAQVHLSRLAISDRAGEVPFQITRSPEQNAVAHDRTAAGVVALPAATLDAQAAALGWRDVDFLKLDVEGHEAQAIRGAQGFLAAQSPLVMLEIRAGREFDLSAAKLLASMDYALYRLLPGPLLLVPADLGAGFESSLLNIFACKRDCAVRLAAAGVLDDAPTDALASARAAGAWGDYVGATAYGRTLGAKWRKRPGFLAGPAEKDYFEGLSAFARSRDTGLGASERHAALLHAFKCVGRALESDASLAKQLSYARLAWELGQRDPALDALALAAQRVEDEWRQALEEPFLAPSPRYETVAGPERQDDWMRCAIIEQVEKMRAFSSLYVQQTTHEVLAPIMDLPFRSAEMDRRWQLVRMAQGAPREPVPALCTRSAENLNPEYWCRRSP